MVWVGADGEDNGMVVVEGAEEIEAAEFIEPRSEREEKERKLLERPRFGKKYSFSIGYGKRLLGVSREASPYSTYSSVIPRISLPDSVSVIVGSGLSIRKKQWEAILCIGLRAMLEPNPRVESLTDLDGEGIVLAMNPSVELGLAHHWEKVFAETDVEVGCSVLSQAFADNAHTGKVYDLALFKVSSAWTIGMSFCMGTRITEKVSLVLRAHFLRYYPSRYVHVETMVGVGVYIR